MLKDILAISGQQGLYKLVAKTKDKLIVESLDDKKRIPAYSSSKISTLEDIAIYTETDEVPLKDVLKKIYDKESGGKAISHKLPDAELKKYFELVLPNYDKKKVYVSDIKKVINWYNILHTHNLLNFHEESNNGSSEKKEEVINEEVNE